MEKTRDASKNEASKMQLLVPYELKQQLMMSLLPLVICQVMFVVSHCVKTLLIFRKSSVVCSTDLGTGFAQNSGGGCLTDETFPADVFIITS